MAREAAQHREKMRAGRSEQLGQRSDRIHIACGGELAESADSPAHFAARPPRTPRVTGLVRQVQAVRFGRGLTLKGRGFLVELGAAGGNERHRTQRF
jgi:hypothetical protein